jgi:DivIVA domain-containing protein
VLLTPADIHNTEFGKAPLGRRGYDEEEVDALLDEVTQEMIKLLEENEVLQRRAGRPDARPDQAAPHSALLAEIDALAAELDRARRACDQAEQNAHRLRRQLDEARQAAATAAPAPTFGVESPDRVLAMAQRTADDYMNEADQKSRELITDARERCDQMSREARDLVANIEAESRRFQTEAAANLQAQHTALINEIEELTQFAEGYRVALEQHVVRQTQLLEGVAVDEPAH